MTHTLLHSRTNAQVKTRTDAGSLPARTGKTPAGVPAITAPLEKRWEFLANCPSLLTAWERGFVAAMGRPKQWRGDKLWITQRQQACLAGIFAKLCDRLARERTHG